MPKQTGKSQNGKGDSFESYIYMAKANVLYLFYVISVVAVGKTVCTREYNKTKLI